MKLDNFLILFIEYLKFFFIGVFGGTISGFLGIGGGVVILPVLLYITGVEVKAATALSTLSVLFASSTGTFLCSRNKTINLRYGFAFGLISSATSFLGSYFTSIIPGLAIKITYLISAFIATVFFLLINKNNSTLPEIEAGVKKVPAKKEWIIIVLISLIAGFFFGLIGVGGGFLYVPVLILLFNLPLKIAVSTSLLIMLLNAIPGIAGKLLTVRFDIFAGLAVAVGSIVGAKLGNLLQKKAKDNVIKIVFTVILSIIIIRVSIDVFFSFK